MATPLLRTKFYIPPLQAGIVHRPRLIQKINEGLTRKITLISAPVGFGKSTLLSEWIPTSQRPVAWLSLEEADNDPTRFCTYFLAALQTLQQDLTKEAQAILHSESQPFDLAHVESFITLLVNYLSDHPQELALVLDDYHQIHNQVIHQGIAFLIDHLPPNMHIILTSRADPPLPLPRLRARGQMNELRGEDLRFTAEEAVIFLNQVQLLDLASDQILALEARTEGWIAGLQLAAISMQKGVDKRGFIQSFTGSHRFVLDYLVDEVLRHQSEDEQSFLLDTSILEGFTGELCNAITCREDGQAMLEKLEQANLFLIPLDDERRWYRYHHLFADLLRRRLRELQPERIKILHQRACEWFESEGLLPEAIHHALAVGDFERAARLIEKASEHQRQMGEITTLAGWMSAIPASIRRNFPALCLSYARALADSSQNIPITELIKDAEAGLAADQWKNDPRYSSLNGQIAALRAYLAMIQNRFEDSIQLSRQARELLGPEEARWLIFVSLNLAGAYRFSDDWASTGQAYLDASELSQRVGDRMSALQALGLRGEVLEAQGHLREADRQFRQVLELAKEYEIPNTPVTGYALTGLGRIWCEWNDLESAERFVLDGIENGKKAAFQDVLLRGYLALARIRQARGDFAGALAVLDLTEPVARRIGMGEIENWINAYRCQAWLARGEIQAAIDWASAISGTLYYSKYPSMAIELAKVQLVLGRPDEAYGVLEHALVSTRAIGRMGNAIQILVNIAIVQRIKGETDKAFSTLWEALNLAAPEGYIRSFIEEGETMRSMLADSVSKGERQSQTALPGKPTLNMVYARTLLDIFTRASVHQPAASHVLPAWKVLPEPLSDREVEVLRLMAAGLSNRDIADKDIVSINTVKTQVKSIYGKLGTHTRTDAISAARKLGLV